MGCTFTKIRLLRRTFLCRMLEFGMYYAIVLYTSQAKNIVTHNLWTMVLEGQELGYN